MNVQFNEINEEIFFKTVSTCLIEEINRAIQENGLCRFVLSGGRTPLGIFDQFVENENKLDWSKVDIYWLDERCVSQDSPESNFGVAKRHLIDRLRKKPKYYPMYTSGEYSQAALEYEELIRRNISKNNEIPVFDIALIGIGSDGHFASIFPEGNVLAEKYKLIKHEYVEKLGSNRISMTLPLINKFKHGVVVSRGKDKSWVVESCKSKENMSLPISRVNIENGTLTWFIC
ncbi:6-phosphogluconolactonase [Hydrogenovibrio sp. SC-1]|uniref:6-phosphogluconolactonase n=1 Tax=Hydrogenovibrio sp. SC-1 TaxID=2065820 RepID=UPI000C7E374B|nr:6-phosphogluconolactonase [Hydrogenovibrio sp. SC-1]PLA75535.1 6-phosphogluconolactonase [Hydrogenovibrio sp. SC-1]